MPLLIVLAGPLYLRCWRRGLSRRLSVAGKSSARRLGCLESPVVKRAQHDWKRTEVDRRPAPPVATDLRVRRIALGIGYARQLQRAGQPVEAILLNVGEPVRNLYVLRFRTQQEIEDFSGVPRAVLHRRGEIRELATTARLPRRLQKRAKSSSILDTAEELDCDEVVMPAQAKGCADCSPAAKADAVRRQQRHVPVVLIDRQGRRAEMISASWPVVSPNRQLPTVVRVSPSGSGCTPSGTRRTERDDRRAVEVEVEAVAVRPIRGDPVGGAAGMHEAVAQFRCRASALRSPTAFALRMPLDAFSVSMNQPGILVAPAGTARVDQHLTETGETTQGERQPFASSVPSPSVSQRTGFSGFSAVSTLSQRLA